MDVVIEEKCYTGENAPYDSFRIIGAYANRLQKGNCGKLFDLPKVPVDPKSITTHFSGWLLIGIDVFISTPNDSKCDDER